MPISAVRAWQVLGSVLGLQLRKAGAAEPQHTQDFPASRGGCELLWIIPICSFFSRIHVANIAYLKDLLFLSFFSCILTYIDFICLKPYPSFLCSFCLSPLFIFYVCWNVNLWGLHCWTNSSTLVEPINVGKESIEHKGCKNFCSSLLEVFLSYVLGTPLPRTICKAKDAFGPLRVTELGEPKLHQRPLFSLDSEVCVIPTGISQGFSKSLRLSVWRSYALAVLCYVNNVQQYSK